MIKYQGISTLEVLVEAENYNNWIAHQIEPHLSVPVLEIGAGTGNLTNKCLKKRPLHVTDSDEGLINHLKKKFSNKKNIFVQKLDITKKIPDHFVNFFSSVYAINVLEHIENDQKALKNIFKLIKPKGKLILLVPAKKLAYTKLDKELGHHRRYEKEELVNKIENAGFTIEKIYFFNIVGLISWYVRDKVNRNNVHLKPHHIAIFDSIVPFLRKIESLISIPMGISLIAVAKKE